MPTGSPTICSAPSRRWPTPRSSTSRAPRTRSSPPASSTSRHPCWEPAAASIWRKPRSTWSSRSTGGGGDHHLAGRALISKGTYVGYQGDAEESVRLIEQGLGLIDESQDPRLLFAALHNQARFLNDCGRLREARIALWKLKARRLDPGGRINELKIRWLEGQINAGLGELDRAELALLDVRRGFAEAGLGYKAALAGLELGAVMLRRGQTDAAVAEVLAAVEVFQSLGIAREAGVSVLLLKKGCERQIADVGLLEYVIGLLRKVEEPAAGRIEPPVEE